MERIFGSSVYVGTLVCALLAAIGLSTASAATPQVGLASPMDKVMIKGGVQGWPFEGQWAADVGYQYDLALAKNEHEAVQIVVAPDTALTNVQVAVSDLQPQGGQGAFDGQVQVWLVGHVDASDDPPSNLNIGYPEYVDGYTGWWPDPLLTFTNTCDVQAGDRVAFWVDVATTPGTPAGDYTGTITVTADNADLSRPSSGWPAAFTGMTGPTRCGTGSGTCRWLTA